MITSISPTLQINSLTPSTSTNSLNPGPTSPSSDFSAILGGIVNGAVGTLQTGEAAAIQGLKGTMPAYKVIESVMEAQRTLQSALAIRDKAVSAFQEITRMAI